MKRAAPAAAGLAATLLLVACNPPLRPVTPPAGSEGETETRVEAMEVGPRAVAVRAATYGLQLVLHARAAPGSRLARALLTRVTRPPCSGGSPALLARVDTAAPVPLPVSVGGGHALALDFLPTPEEALEGPTALDLEIEHDGRPSCLRTPLGAARDWQRPQLAMHLELTAGAPLRALGDLRTPVTADERLGALLGPVDVSAGVRVGLASCPECYEGAAVLAGPAFAATYFPFTARPLALGIQVSYASLFDLFHYPDDPSGSDPRLRDWYQVLGAALQLDWLGPPRGSRVRLKGRDFNDWGIEVFDQLWIPTQHADRPTVVLGLGLVNRLAL